MEIPGRAIDLIAILFGGSALMYSLYLGQADIALAALGGILGYAGGRANSQKQSA